MSHRTNFRSSNRYLYFPNAQSLDPPWSGVKWYVNGFIPDDSSEHTLSCITDPDTVPNQILPVPGRDQSSLPGSSDHTVDPRKTPESKSDWKSTAYATTKLAINLVKESSDAFPPLKSVAGGLSAILNHCDVRCVFSQTKQSMVLTTVLANHRLSPNDRIFDAPS